MDYLDTLLAHEKELARRNSRKEVVKRILLNTALGAVGGTIAAYTIIFIQSL